MKSKELMLTVMLSPVVSGRYDRLEQNSTLVLNIPFMNIKPGIGEAIVNNMQFLWSFIKPTV